jgi:hypothetical protein
MKKATSADFQRLSKSLDVEVPFVLKSLLQECNGCIWLMEKKLLSVESIIENTLSHASNKLWKPDYIPVALDGSGGDSLLVYNGKNGSIYEWDEDSGLSDALIASSFSRFLEEYRNHLLNGHYEFVEDVGIIEHVSSSPHKARNASSHK